MLPDSTSGMFLPWASTGYDKTTGHRLRLPSNLLEEISILSENKPKLIKKSSLDLFKQFFSMREFSILERMAIVPLRYDDQTAGILLITDAGILSLSDDEVVQILTDISNEAGNILFSSRQQKLEKLQFSDKEQSIDPYQTLSAYIEDAKSSGKHVRILLIDLTNFENQLKDTLQDADAFRINQDLYKIVASMIPEQGEVIHIAYSKLLIFLPGRTLIDPNLLLHQMKLALKRFFHVQDDLPEIESFVRSFPEDGEDENELLKGLLQ